MFPGLFNNVACFRFVSGDGHLGGSPAERFVFAEMIFKRLLLAYSPLDH